MSAIFWAVFLTIPALAIWLAHHQAWAHRLGVVVLCYVAGLLVGNFGGLPVAAVESAEDVGTLAIGMALPLLLMSLDIRRCSEVAGKAMLSMLLATVSVVCVATCLYFLFADGISEKPAHLAAMAVGVYTGGTPNLAAIKAGLDIADTDYLLFHSIDTLLGGLYMLAMLTVGIPFFRRILPATTAGTESAEELDLEESYQPFLQLENVPSLLATLCIAGAAVAAAYGLANALASVFGEQTLSPLLILVLTTIGVGLSFSPARRRLKYAYRIGMYLIYVFCFAIASATTLDMLAAADPMIAVFTLAAVLGSVIMHALLCRLSGVDGDTFMVTSVAAVCSPPFVPLVARALNNRGLIFAGMMTGIVGYAIGNYLGITLALILSGS
ncbi:DUF819 family protein [Halioglobus maricola]|uniref:DUF819 family protein n=1 Tax=Halioglobus maricola TaxID=2601894 RepID=A0A5P9NJM0_9GAMM|nr:DUF819 family protein [Halioglobus maricola]QFU75706.1 DUF819 family protein [Halioglobus maricola]